MAKAAGKAKPSAPRKKPHEEFAEQIVAMLENGVAPWQKSWKAGEYYAPFNPVSGTIYRGVNRLMLSNFDMADPRWMTFKQANDKGYRVKAGSHAMPVEFWQWTEEVDRKDEDGNIIYGPDGKPEKETVELDRPGSITFPSSMPHSFKPKIGNQSRLTPRRRWSGILTTRPRPF